MERKNKKLDYFNSKIVRYFGKCSGKIVWLSILIFAPVVGLACPDKIAIVDGAWPDVGGSFSLAIQAQSADGKSCDVNDTLRLKFEAPANWSNKGDTGEPDAYISKNSANRNFYYHGSAGDKITVKAGFGAIGSWPATWQADYTVGGGGSNFTASDDEEDASDSDDDDYSVLSSQAEAGAYTKSSKWQIGIGKDRLVLAGSRVTFKIDDNNVNQATIYEWSFGDGGRVRGRVASHTYRHPGVYQVVVRARAGSEAEAVAQVKVKVVAPKVAVAFIGQTGSVKLSNQNGEEVNLGGFSLIAGEQVPFAFPPDTILGVGQEIVVDELISDLTYDSYLALFDPVGRPVAESGLPAGKREEAAIKLEQLQSSLRQAQNKLASQVIISQLPVAKAVTTEAEAVDSSLDSDNPNTVTLTKSRGSLLSRLLNLLKL